MKKLLATSILSAIAISLAAQTTDADEKKTKSWFESNVKIAQSMETAELKEEPAQFQITLPNDGSSSWLINLGVSIKVKSKSPNWLAKTTIEYHRNTLTDEEQNNLEVGYSFTYQFPVSSGVEHFLTGDLKYVYDDIKSKNSIASNLLYTFLNDNGPWNTPRRLGEKKIAEVKMSLFGGLQLQETFNAQDEVNEGFILRPIFKYALYYDLLKKDSDPITPDPAFRFFLDYTGRVDAISSIDKKENYTQLLKTGIEWFLSYKPVRASLGASFNYGSDPLRGLEKQQFWLFSINVFKK